MPYVTIRSSSGQRSYNKVTASKDQDRAQLREDLVAVLKGLTLQINISDVIFQQDDTPENGTQKVDDKEDHPSQEKMKNILSDLHTKLIISDSVSETANISNPEREAETKKAEPRSETGKPEDNRPVGGEPTIDPIEVKPKLKVDFKPASSIRPAQVSTIIPKRSLGEDTTAKPEGILKDADLSSTSALPKNDDNKDAKEAVQAKVPDLPKPKTVSKSFKLVKGNLKIGSIVESCVVGFGGTDENPIYYIPYDTEKFIQINSLIQELGPSIESQQPVSSVGVGDIIFAKSKDDNTWYRSIVQKVNDEDVEVFFFDWGLSETLDLSRIRHLSILELGLSNNPAAAVMIEINNAPGPLVNRFLVDNERLNLKVESYDDSTDKYVVTILDE